MQLSKTSDLVQRQIVTGQMEQCVDQHGTVSVREHKAVAVAPIWIFRIMSEKIAPQHFSNVRHSHRHAWMSGICGLYGIHRQCSDRVGFFQSCCSHGAFHSTGSAVQFINIRKSLKMRNLTHEYISTSMGDSLDADYTFCLEIWVAMVIVNHCISSRIGDDSCPAEPIVCRLVCMAMNPQLGPTFL